MIIVNKVITKFYAIKHLNCLKIRCSNRSNLNFLIYNYDTHYSNNIKSGNNPNTKLRQYLTYNLYTIKNIYNKKISFFT